MSTKRKSEEISGNIARQMLHLLDQIDRPTTVCSFGDRPVTLPGMDVDGIGSIGLPLGKAQAKELIQLCQQAPYGKGTKTLVDTDVRRVWELDPTKFQLTNPHWDAFIDSIVKDVRSELGLHDLELNAHLYKLLVYEKGGFFLPHKDGEKLDGMVATLVVALPAVHAGGELVVSHEGKTQVISMTGAAMGREVSYAAFYADCDHEVRKVTSGYRLCLTYNVTLARSKKKSGVKAPSFHKVTTQVAETLTRWSLQLCEASKTLKTAMETPGVKLAITLSHEYTKDGLRINQLKGTDRATADVLFEAAKQANCVAHLGLITIYQSGTAEGGYDPYEYGYRRNRYYDSFDDDEDENDNGDDSGSNYTMGEIIEDSLSVDHWSDANGDNVRLGEISLKEQEIISETDVDDWTVSREDFEGYTGNAGMTLERWYHRAAVVIWPQEHHFNVLCAAGTDASIGGFVSMINRLKKASKQTNESLRDDCLRFAQAIINSWNPHRSTWSSSHETIKPIDRAEFVGSLCELNDADLVQQYLTQVLSADQNAGIHQQLAKFCNKHGWELFENPISETLASVTSDTLMRNVGILERLCTVRDKNASRLKVCRRFIAVCVDGLIEFDQQFKTDDWRFHRLDRKEILMQLVKSAVSIDARDPLSRFIEHVLTSKHYDLIDHHVAAILGIESKLTKLAHPIPGITAWLHGCQQQLANRTDQKPQPPADFRRNSTFPCTCKDCQTLRRFLDDPNEKSVRLPLAKARRQHLHNIIDRHKLDVTHVTQRTGRPQVLVCTKTTASFKEAVRIYERDLKLLADVKSIQHG
jgi:hypothetical protein